jgi:hypothetical protein
LESYENSLRSEGALLGAICVSVIRYTEISNKIEIGVYDKVNMINIGKD